MGGGQGAQAHEQVGSHRDVVVEEEQELAARLLDEEVAGRPGQSTAVDRADPRLGQPPLHGVGHARIALGAHQELPGGSTHLVLQASETSVEHGVTAAGHDADADLRRLSHVHPSAHEDGRGTRR